MNELKRLLKYSDLINKCMISSKHNYAGPKPVLTYFEGQVVQFGVDTFLQNFFFVKAMDWSIVWGLAPVF